MRPLIAGFLVTLFLCSTTPANASSQQDGLNNNASCRNPRFSYSVLTKRIYASTTFNYDITAEGTVENIRVKASTPKGLLNKAARNSLQQWRYFAFLEDGVEVPRKDVEITFTYGGAPDEKKASCAHTPWPAQAESMGDSSNPYNHLKLCYSLIMPRVAATHKTSGQIVLTYDIAPDGQVRNIRTVRSSGPDFLSPIAEKALMRWTYHPFILDDKAIARHGLTVTFSFGDPPVNAPTHQCSFAAWETANTVTTVVRKRPW